MDRYSQRSAQLNFWDAHKEHGQVNAGYTALNRLPAYSEAAQRQMDRMQIAAQQLEDLASTGWKSEEQHVELRYRYDAVMRQYLAELHFYLTCWASSKKLMGVVNNVSGPANDVYARHKETFEGYSNARDELEHFDQRLAGRKQEQRTLVSEHPGLHITFELQPQLGVLRIGDRRWDVGPASLETFERVMFEWYDAIDADARIKLMSTGSLQSTTPSSS